MSSSFAEMNVTEEADPDAPSAFDLSPNKMHGYRMVVMEMTLAICGIVFNLIVLISIREKESLLNSTSNVLLANLCFANLVSAVFVKSIAVIYNGYAVAASLWEVELAFCAIHTITFRATWAVFPYSLVVLCWNGMLFRANEIFKGDKSQSDEFGSSKGDTSQAMVTHGYRTATVAVIETEDPCRGAAEGEGSSLQLAPGGVSLTGTKQSSIEVLSAPGDVIAEMEKQAAAGADEGAGEEEQMIADDLMMDEDEMAEGLTGRQKSMLGFIWCVSAAYAILAKEILSKERFVPCSVRQNLSEQMNLISLFIAIGVPLVFGPILCPIVHLVLTFCNVCCYPCFGRTASAGDGEEPASGAAATGAGGTDGCNFLMDFGLLFSFSAVFLIVYPTHMYVVEVYLATTETHFLFMAFKYCFGCLHLVLLPIVILIIRTDIRRAAIDVFLKRSATQQQGQEQMNFEQLQTHVGIGVNPGQ